MKKILAILLFFLLPSPVLAQTYNIAGKVIDIPAPHGFVQVTDQMGILYKYSLMLGNEDPVNDQLGFFIPESLVPVALRNKIPTTERYFLLKVGKTTKKINLKKNDFNDLAESIKQENEKSVKHAIEIAKKANKKLTDVLGLAYSIDDLKVVPLSVHHETDNSIAFSQYVVIETSSNEGRNPIYLVYTSTYMNISGKLIFLYCYGSEKDLEWTRNASRKWAKAISAKNRL